jgi:N-carbamoylputrescine amidase
MRCAERAEENLSRAAAMLGDAANQGATLAILPELFLGHYFCQTEDHAQFDRAEAVPGPTTHALAEIAAKTGMTILGSVFERRAAGLYHNTAVLLDFDGKLAGVYRKMHIPDDPLYYEKFYFTPGDLGFRAFETNAAVVGPLVCWDQWYPEAARLTALAGAEILCYPTAIGWHPAEKAEYGPGQHDAWRTIQRSHAIANGLYVAVANRVGHEGPRDGGIEFWGGSFVADPFGRIIAEADSQTETVLVVDCPLGRVEETRRHWPFLRDRRIDAYSPIADRYGDRSR